MLGGQTRIPIRLEDGPAEQHGVTIATLTPAAMAKLSTLQQGEMVSLTVHACRRLLLASPTTRSLSAGTDPTAGTILLTAHLSTWA